MGAKKSYLLAHNRPFKKVKTRYRPVYRDPFSDPHFGFFEQDVKNSDLDFVPILNYARVRSTDSFVLVFQTDVCDV